MILYAFRCESGCGTTTQFHPMADRPDSVECPKCQGSARRTLASPHVGRADAAAMALHDRTRATGDRPAVVSRPPSAGRRQTVTTNPLHRTLPRP